MRLSEKDYIILLERAKMKIEKIFFLVEASLKKIKSYDIEQDYSPEELEPYDALTDRFIRCVEMFIKFFKTYDSYKAVTNALTYRDLINIMAKLDLVTNVELWMNMRDVRNRIVHDYLPEQTKNMFDAIMNEFFNELKNSKKKITLL